MLVMCIWRYSSLADSGHGVSLFFNLLSMDIISKRSEVLKMIKIFWDGTLCSLVNASVNVLEKPLLHCRWTQKCLKHLPSYHTSRCHRAEDHNLTLCLHFQYKSWWNFQYSSAWHRHEISLNLNSRTIHEVMLEINTSFAPHYSNFHTILNSTKSASVIFLIPCTVIKKYIWTLKQMR
jgi:hypothetical protein